MGCGKPNDDDKPPVPLKQSDEPALTRKESEASHHGQISHMNNTSAPAFMPFPFASLPNSPWENAHGMHQSYTQGPRISNYMPGFMRPSTSQNPSINYRSSSLGGSLRNQDTFPSGLNHPQVNMNFVPNPTTNAGRYHINAHIGEGKASDLNQSQITESSLYSECSPSMAKSTRETLVNNDVKVSASYPGKLDGSFLTLGIGGNVESRTKCKFSSREIASCLEQSGNCHVGQTTANYSTLSHNLTCGSAGFQSNPDGLPSSMCSSTGALTSSCNNDGIPHYGPVGLSSNVFQSPHIPESFKHYDFFASNDRNFGIARKSHGVYPAIDPYDHYQGDPAPPLLPFSSTNTYSSHPGFTKISDPALESANFMQTIFQPTIGQPQNYHARNDRDVTTSFGSNSISLRGSAVTQDFQGMLIPPMHGSMTQAVGGSPSSIGVQPIGPITSTLGVHSAPLLGNTTFPEKIVPQIAEATAIKPATVGPFPRRLGMQLDECPQSANQDMPPGVMGVQTRSGVHQSQPVQLTRSLLGSSSGYPQDSLAPEFDVQMQSFSSGPVPLNAKVDKISQVSNAIGQPSVKRKAVEPAPVASWGRRRKLVHLPTIHNSMMHPGQGTAASLPPPVPSATPHIRWQGFDRHPQPVGQKCLLCNRDLSFTAEGPVYQPSIPPAVAVLPCGHAFHDNCLQRITPEDQIKDPPCIPCAIGET